MKVAIAGAGIRMARDGYRRNCPKHVATASGLGGTRNTFGLAMREMALNFVFVAVTWAGRAHRSARMGLSLGETSPGFRAVDQNRFPNLYAF